MDAFPIVAYSFTSNNQKLKDVTKKLNQQLVPKLQTIDGVQNAQEKIEAGAELLQVYSGLIYHGPSLVKELVKAIK